MNRDIESLLAIAAVAAVAAAAAATMALARGALADDLIAQAQAPVAGPAGTRQEPLGQGGPRP